MKKNMMGSAKMRIYSMVGSDDGKGVRVGYCCWSVVV